MNSTALIENTAEDFWMSAGGMPYYPCDIKMAIILTLPLELYAVAELRVSHVREWSRRAHVLLHVRGQDRRLHGCLIAYRGKGILFFDEQDPDDEQRFTLAHELAHFLLDYQTPRQLAIATLGSSILPVLDGERLPALEERLHAALSRVHLGTLSHFMERPDEGLPTMAVLDIEDRADQLALELLAPALPLYELMRQANLRDGFNTRLQFLHQHLLTTYGLPSAIAADYARYILHELGEPTFRDWLFSSAK